MPRQADGRTKFPDVEVLFWFCGLDLLHSKVSLAQENREYILALKEHGICSIRFASAARHLDRPAGEGEEAALGTLAALEVAPWARRDLRGVRLALVVLDAFDLAGADYPVELIRSCAASLYAGAHVSLVLRFIADTDACWVPEGVLAAFERLWVPSTHCLMALPLSAAKCTAVVPEICLPPACQPPTAPTGSEPFVILALMNDYGLDDLLQPDQANPHRWNAARKNLGGLLEAFCSEFPAGTCSGRAVELLVKSTRPGLQDSLSQLLACTGHNATAGQNLHRRVRVVGDWLPDIGEFLRLGHCLVAPSRGEGWCRPLAEALSVGMPVVGCAFGGQRDFLSAETGYLVGATLVKCPFVLGRGWGGRSRWGDPDIGELRRTLRHVITHYEEALALARVGQQRVTRWCSPAAVAAAIGEYVIRPCAPPPSPKGLMVPAESFEAAD